jgi:hypothetical protein
MTVLDMNTMAMPMVLVARAAAAAASAAAAAAAATATAAAAAAAAAAFFEMLFLPAICCTKNYKLLERRPQLSGLL